MLMWRRDASGGCIRRIIDCPKPTIVIRLTMLRVIASQGVTLHIKTVSDTPRSPDKKLTISLKPSIGLEITHHLARPYLTGERFCRHYSIGPNRMCVL